jgi:enoyl-CoA hydratase/carnithine racemase
MLRRIGQARALELCMTGEMIGADEALRIGLVNKVVEPDALLETAVKTAQTIAAMGPLAIAKVKEVIHEGANKSLDDANLQEQTAFASLFASADQKEGMAAFMEKRAAAFKGE